MPFSLERHHGVRHGAVTVPFKAMPRRPGATPSLLSCRRSQTLVGALAPAVLMSGVADSGRKSGHGNIDANDPTETWGAAVVYLAGMPRNANIHSGSRVIGKNP